MDWDIIGMLSLVAFCAGFFDAIAGGGGLITLPALFLAGVPPVSAIATNKFQAAAATLSATAVFARKGLIPWHEGRFLILFGMLGGASGAFFVSSVNTSWLEACVPILLMLVAIYFSIAPKLSTEGGKKEYRYCCFHFPLRHC
ncbi:TSUP family transporter [Aeromonas dhakensis]|uniref:TSUP family transporter n=1 Tax=Aeromonas dhakensis TaxID=196024 RepID=UPI003EC4FAFA